MAKRQGTSRKAGVTAQASDVKNAGEWEQQAKLLHDVMYIFRKRPIEP